MLIWKSSFYNKHLIKKKQVNAKYLLMILGALLLFGIGYILGYEILKFRISQIITQQQNNLVINGSQTLDTKLVREVIDNLDANYIEKDLDYTKFSYGMAEGIVNSLEDKYTIFLDPEENAAYKDNRSPDLEGVGVVLNYNGEFTEIESVLESYPAYLAGFTAGDIVLEVDGEDMRNQKPAYVSSKVKGKSGSKVKIKVLRVGDTQTIEKTLERTKIEVKNIDYKEIDSEITQVRVNRFIDDSVEEFNNEWDKIVSEVCSDSNNKLIIDLRYNPGGYVNSALYMLEDFLPNGSILMKEIDREGDETTKLSERTPRCLENPVVVLINSSSASASEIFAGGLKAYKRAYLIGESTVGKGLEQKVVDLSDGSAMHIVFRKWTTPDGFNPTPEKSIEPDLKVEAQIAGEEVQEDAYIEKAKTYLNAER